jgi:FkbM family methyltransferase
VKKICAAITGNQPCEKTTQVFYVNPEDIQKFNLPDWLKGCNSIHEPHPTTQRILQEKNVLHLLNTQNVPLISIQTLLQDHNVGSIHLLKIDTEGHDCVILNGLIECCTKNLDLWPREIIFESNSLSNTNEISLVLETLVQYYTILSRNENTHLQIKNGGSVARH